MSSYGMGGLSSTGYNNSGMGMFQFGGLASGLDTKKIISQLVALERLPIKALENKKAFLKSQKKAFNDLQDKLADLEESLASIRKSSNFLEFTATPDDEGFFTATASHSAQQGTWQISVDQLATVQRNKSALYADKDSTAHGTGTLTITIDGTKHDILIDQNNNTLQGIAGAINDADIGVTATVIDTGIGTNRYLLVISSKEAGTDNAFTLSTDDGDQDLVDLVNEINTGDGGVTSGKFQTAQDAKVTINGIQITRGSNTITDAIPGVTLNLLKTHDPSGSNPDTNLTVSTDSSAIEKKIQDFVDDYNAVMEFINGQGKVGEKGKAEGVLLGDFTLTSIQNRLRSIAGGLAETGGTYTMLALVGITSDKEGKLSFDRSKFEEALQADEQDVKDLFTKSGVGVADRLYTAVDDITDSVDGIIKTRLDGIDDIIKQLDDRIRREEDRVAKYEETLVQRFAGYENLIAMYQAQGYSLGAYTSGGTGGGQ